MKKKGFTKFLILVPLTVLLVLSLLSGCAKEEAPAALVKATLGLGSEPINMDALISKTGVDMHYLINVVDSFMYQATDGTNQPGLAESWEISEGGKIIDFTLRRDVKFHNGMPFTAKDVVFSFERITDPQWGTWMRSNLLTVEKIEIIDDYHVRFYFTQPDATFFSGQGWIYIGSKEYYDEVGEEQFIKNPVGTGPYKLVSRTIGVGCLLEVFEDYWGDAPQVDEVEIRVALEPGTRVAMLKAGEVDLINTTPYTAVPEIEADPQLKMVRMGAGHPQLVVWFDLRTMTEEEGNPFANLKVRQAVAHAIDYEGILNKVQFGIPEYYWGLAKGEIGYDPTLKRPEYDPELAKQLLAEAGYPDGFDTILYNGITERVAGMRETAEAIAMNLNQVGIRTKTEHLEYGIYIPKGNYAAGPRDWGDSMMLWTGGSAGLTDPAQAWNIFSKCDGPYSFYCNPEVDDLFSRSLSEMDLEKRAELIKKGIRILQDDVYRVPIMMNTVVVSMQKNVEFTPTIHDWLALVRFKDVRFK